MPKESNRRHFLDIPFTKWSGAGNTFLLVTAADLSSAGRGNAHPEEEDCAPGAPMGIDLAKAACSTAKSAPGADGLLLIRESTDIRVAGDREQEVEADFWNRDGSPAAFCGNGARCLAAWALARTGAPRVRGRLASTKFEGWREGEEIAIRVPSPRLLARFAAKELLHDASPLAPRLREAAWIDSGVPHLCLLLEVREKEAAPGSRKEGLATAPPLDREVLERLGRELRTDARFAPEGTNVDFVWDEGGGEPPAGLRAPSAAECADRAAAKGSRETGPNRIPRLRLETFERGLESLSPACGSGALAVGFLLLEREMAGRVQMTMSSGERLSVEKNGPAWMLRGPAVPLARGVYRWERIIPSASPPC